MCPTQVVTYQFSGEFGGRLIKGNQDFFGLAGEPFSITLDACESRQPSKTGPDDAIYSPIEWRATLDSYVFGAITIRPTAMTFGLVQPSTGSDFVAFGGDFTLFGGSVYIRGTIALPGGTLASTSIAPFSQVSMFQANSTFFYSIYLPSSWQASHAYSIGDAIVDPSGNGQQVTTAGTSGTTAPAWDDTTGGTTTDGTVVWTCEGAVLAELSVIGTASGTAGGAGQSVSVFGQGDAAVLRAGIYSGAYGHFPGLDEVIVEVPRNPAGMGQVDVGADGGWPDGQPRARPRSINFQYAREFSSRPPRIPNSTLPGLRRRRYGF